jgi:hypothetical protein
MSKLLNNPLILILTSFATIGFVALGFKQWNYSSSKDTVVTIKLSKISLPFITDKGTAFSSNGIPRGSFQVPRNQDINRVELTAIFLDRLRKNSQGQYAIKQVILIGGSFPDDIEFELSEWNRRVIVPAKIVDRISLKPSKSSANFFYLFDKLEPNFQASSKYVAIDLDSRILSGHLSIRKSGLKPGPWLDLKFIPSATAPILSPHNEYGETFILKKIVPQLNE